MLDAFLATGFAMSTTSSSIVSRPTIRSRSAIRFCSARWLSGAEKTFVARSTKCCFHADTTCDASRSKMRRSRYSRQTSAMLLLPLSSSSTTWT